jgi:hypothetical protein
MGKVSRLLLSRTAMAEGKEYFPSKEREQNEDFRNREMQKRDERTNALRPKKEKVKNRWRDDGYEPRDNRFSENRDRFDCEGERQERRGFHSERRFDDRRDFDRNENRRDFDRRSNVFDDRRGNQQNAPFREHRNIEDKNRFNSGEINLASRRSHGKGFKKPTFKK